MSKIQPLAAAAARILGISLFGLLAGPSFAGCEQNQDTSLTLTRGGVTVETLSLADLDGLEQQSFRTTTQWTDGTIEFSGPALADVLARLDLSLAETSVRLVAANRYSVVLSPEVVAADTPILATRRDGCTFGLREMGPLWVVFPYDLDKKFRTEQVYAVSIWQLVEIQIEP